MGTNRLEWLQDNHGNYPAMDPQTVSEIRRLSTADVNDLLDFYGLSTEGGLPVKRRRLLAHLGQYED